jgi:hypothetical protein
MLNDAIPDDASESYDPRKRDPQFAHASSSPLWELVRICYHSFTLGIPNLEQTPLLNHYHPAVSLHARQLLSSQPLTANADLSLNTISHFLDRFVYKNPKKVKANANNANVVVGKGKGASAMQPAASGVEGGGVKLMKGEMGDMEDRVNERDFLRKKETDVPVDQVSLLSTTSIWRAIYEPALSFSSTSSFHGRVKKRNPKPPRLSAGRIVAEIPIPIQRRKERESQRTTTTQKKWI